MSFAKTWSFWWSPRKVCYLYHKNPIFNHLQGVGSLQVQSLVKVNHVGSAKLHLKETKYLAKYRAKKQMAIIILTGNSQTLWIYWISCAFAFLSMEGKSQLSFRALQSFTKVNSGEFAIPFATRNSSCPFERWDANHVKQQVSKNFKLWKPIVF